MAKTVIEKSTCDFCGEPSDDTFTLSHDGITAVLDVCEDHAAPYDLAMEKGSVGGRRRPQTHAGASLKVHSVVPVD